MRLSTSTNLIGYRPDFVSYIPILESIPRLKQAGFDAIDLNLCDVSRPFYLLCRDDWQSWIAQIGSLAERLSLPISQAHAPYYNAFDPSSGKADQWEPMILRSLQAAGRLQVPWIVMHPNPCRGPEEFIQRNRSYFLPFAQLAAREGTGIALENLCDENSADPATLCALVDSFDMPNVGVCWDFGHAHLMKTDQPSALRRIGKRLKATHVADNSGALDDHIAPMMGVIDWHTILPVLSQIGYEGDLTYEIHCVTSRLPDELVDEMARYCEKLGRYLLGLALSGQ